MERNEKASAGTVRAEQWVRREFVGLSRRQVEEALEHGLCTLGGRRLKKGDKVAAGQVLDCGPLDVHLRLLRLGSPDLGVTPIQEFADYVVVDKSPGVKSHPLGLFERDTVTHWAWHRYPEMRNAFPETLPTVTPHRLDTGTSGVLLVCKNPAAFEQWRERFQKKQVTKIYEAWCWGKPRTTAFSVEVPVGHAAGNRKKMVVVTRESKFIPPIQPTHSEVKVRECHPAGYFRAEIVCRTGVTHQVRVHLAHLGFPLVGDSLYDPDFESRSWRPSHHLLRASRLDWEDQHFNAAMDEFRQLSAFPEVAR